MHLGDVRTTSALWVLSLLLTDDEGDCSEGHDHGAHQEVRQRQRHQEVVGGALQLPAILELQTKVCEDFTNTAKAPIKVRFIARYSGLYLDI